MTDRVLPRPNALMMVVVVIPTTIALLYYGLFASNIYFSESRFLVRSPDKSSASPLGLLLSAGGFSTSGDESHAVVEYVRSRDALHDVDHDHMVEKAYGLGKASWFDRFGGMFSGTSNEHLYEYYSNKVSVEFDASTQVTRLSVAAFAPADAKIINERLLRGAEALVNELNERGRRDAIATVSTQVDELRTRATASAVALARFRNSRKLLDPEKQATVGLQMISKLQDELVAAQTQLEVLRSVTPNNPQIPSVRTRIAGLGGAIKEQSQKIAGNTTSLSSVAVRYQRLQLDSQLADKQLAAAMTGLQDAENEARKKHAYVERIVEPSLPDYPLAPRRLRGIAATLILGLLAWGVLTTLLAGVREHRD